MNVVMFVIYVLIIEALVFAWLRYLSRLEQNNAKLEMNLSYEKQYKELTEEALESIRKYRHDLAKHIQVMEHLQEEDAALPALIAAMKEQECREKNIAFHQQVPEHLQLGMSDQEQTSLLVNLLDNAIEANEKIEDLSQREILLIIDEKDHACYLTLRNAIALAEGEPFSFNTDKKDAKEHGFGTQIIKEIVKKYQGTFAYQVLEKQQMFEVKIVIPCEAGQV